MGHQSSGTHMRLRQMKMSPSSDYPGDPSTCFCAQGDQINHLPAGRAVRSCVTAHSPGSRASPGSSAWKFTWSQQIYRY